VNMNLFYFVKKFRVFDINYSEN